MIINTLLEIFQSPMSKDTVAAKAAEIFENLYGVDQIDAARQRYFSLAEGLMKGFPESVSHDDVRVFTAAGRTELGGNHTDHNYGKVLAASIQMDAVAIVVPRNDKKVVFKSTGYPDVNVDLNDLSIHEHEKGTTEALVRGIAAELEARGTIVGGFSANAASTVLGGSGLSSSAAVEVLIGKIFDCLYGGGKRSPLEIAQIGQKAENVYFGKPSGLMDQTASASGGAVAIDFGDPKNPKVKQINFDLAAEGFSLCVVDTKGSHADLTPDYAAIPAEMKAVAAHFGKNFLRELNLETLFPAIKELRGKVGDRAILRAIHFFNENDRVDAMLASLEKLESAKSVQEKKSILQEYFNTVNESGKSSWELLQNVYSPKRAEEQGIPLALAITQHFLQHEGACRVHGGGFAGTIQAYIPTDRLAEYKTLMENMFGADSVTVLRIRPIGATELSFS
jgi:galactokinase